MSTIFPARKFVTNAALSTNLVTNGSVTPVPYTVAPSAGSLFAIYEVIFEAYGTGNLTNITGFWNFAALTIGITSEIKLNSVTSTELLTIKNNFDLIEYLGADFLGKTIGNSNIVRGQFTLDPPLTLNGKRGDYFKLIVNDNLTTGGGLGEMVVALKGSVITL